MVFNTEIWDVVIVGAGPAGCVSAITLAKLGRRVLLIEKKQHARFKLGESVQPIASRLIDLYLDTDKPDGIYYESSGNVSLWSGEKPQTTEFYFTTNQHGACLNRILFEDKLRSQAEKHGALFLTRANFLACSMNSAKVWRINLSVDRKPVELKTKFILDCSGRNAVVATNLGIKKIALDNLFAYANWYSSDEKDTDTYTRIESGPSGWWYSNRIENGYDNKSLRVVIYQTDQDLPTAKQASKKDGFAQILNDSELIKPLLSKLRYSATKDNIGGSPANSTSLEQYCGVGWLAVGDAAQAYDPLSSQGIWKAMDSASNAAYMVHYQLKNPHLMSQHNKFLERYADQQKKLWQDYKAKRIYFYQQQNRWLESVFWQRRKYRS